MFPTAATASLNRGRVHFAYGLALVMVVTLGVFARFNQLSAEPPGFYSDEAYYALDAVAVRDGARPIFFEGNNGREPLFIYSVALSLAVFGQTVFAVRVVAAVYGSLALVAGYGAARGLFGPRTALIVTALQAFSLWALLFSRIGLRVSTVPLVVGLLLTAVAYGWRLQRRSLIMLGGALLGLCFYTYIAARLIPLVFLGLGVFWYFFRRATFPRWDWLLAFAAPALVVAAPMLAYALGHREAYFGRAGQVALPLAAAIANLPSVAGQFIWQGDSNWRHNFSGRPVFDPLTAVAFLGGLAWLALRLWRQRDLRAALVFLWLAVLALPTIFSDRAPHFLRALALTPVAFFVPALALEAFEAGVRRWLPGRGGAAWTAAVGCVLVGAHAWATALVWRTYAESDAPRYAFETAATELAYDAQNCAAADGATTWVDERLWSRFPAIPFLAPEARSAALLTLQPRSADMRLCLYVPAGESIPDILAHWPGPVLVEARRAGLDRAEGASEAYWLYTRLALAPTVPVEAQTRFEGGLDLLSAEVNPTSTGVRVRLMWSASQPMPLGLHTFVHARVGDQMLGQTDGSLGGEPYPAETWRDGDQVLQVVDVNGAGVSGATIAIGVYDLESGRRLLTAEGLDQLIFEP